MSQDSKVVISKDKSPFEKIKSATEARRIFEVLARGGQDFYCKGEGSLFAFKPERYLPEAGLHGQVVLFEETDVKAENVVINFNVENERYYTTCEFTPQGETGYLRPTGILYRLERRLHYRVELPASLERGCNIINQDGKSVFISAIVLDVSQGGARLQTLKGKVKDLKSGVRIRCALHIRGKWTFELLGQIMHVIPGEQYDVFGVQWLNVPEGLGRKLLSMMLELQREVLRDQDPE
ncbi:MAG: PilZ domain-containing protein [Bdellovibrionaceae bacterium]|nr:PilZ domain-containing protein [Pseudobdellovibrionaceae bacterium]